MKIDRSEANKKLNILLRKNYKKEDANVEVAKFAMEKHNIGLPFCFGVLTGKISLLEISDECLFWILEAMIFAYNEHKINMPYTLEDWYSEMEINRFSASKYIEEDKYPFVIENCMQVSDDQWVTVMTTEQIMHLYNNQMIHYNRLTQREPTIKNKNGVIQYVITLVEKSVKAISELMKKQLYIPDDISLNINPENNTGWDVQGNTIILEDGAFDIIDGFHRLMAIMRSYRESDAFSYNMIVNIMNFDTDKACRYIAQKDKRNKIKSAYSKSIDTTNEVTSILKRLNESCEYYRGMITRDKNALIDWTSLFTFVDYCFTVKDKKDSIKIQKYLKNALDSFVEEDPEYADKKLTNKEIAILIRTFSYYYNLNISEEEAARKANELLKEDIAGNFPLSKLSKKHFAEIDRRLM